MHLFRGSSCVPNRHIVNSLLTFPVEEKADDAKKKKNRIFDVQWTTKLKQMHTKNGWHFKTYVSYWSCIIGRSHNCAVPYHVSRKELLLLPVHVLRSIKVLCSTGESFTIPAPCAHRPEDWSIARALQLCITTPSYCDSGSTSIGRAS